MKEAVDDAMDGAVIGAGRQDDASGFRVDAWSEALAIVASHYRLSTSVQSAKFAAMWQAEGSDAERIRTLARGTGLRVRFAEPSSVAYGRTPARGGATAQRRAGGGHRDQPG